MEVPEDQPISWKESDECRLSLSRSADSSQSSKEPREPQRHAATNQATFNPGGLS